jgi:hypothetical protein
MKGAFEEYKLVRETVGPAFFKTMGRLYLLSEQERKNLELLYTYYPIEIKCCVQTCPIIGRARFEIDKASLGELSLCDRCSDYVCRKHKITKYDDDDYGEYYPIATFCPDCK